MSRHSAASGGAPAHFLAQHAQTHDNEGVGLEHGSRWAVCDSGRGSTSQEELGTPTTMPPLHAAFPSAMLPRVCPVPICASAYLQMRDVRVCGRAAAAARHKVTIEPGRNNIFLCFFDIATWTLYKRRQLRWRQRCGGSKGMEQSHAVTLPIYRLPLKERGRRTHTHTHTHTHT